MNLNINSLIEKAIWLMTTFLLASFSIFDDNIYISVIIAAITLLILFLDSFTNGFRLSIKLSKFHLWGFGFAGYCILSSLWAINPANSFSKGITIIQIILCMTVIYSHYYRSFQPQVLLSIIEYSGYMIALYYISFFGLGYIKNSLMHGSRIENAFANANTIGISCAISMIIYIYYALYKGNRSLIKLLMVSLSIIVLTVSASRTALIGFVCGSFCLFLFRFASKSVIKTALKWSVICAVFIGLLSILLTLEVFDSLNQRMEGLIALIAGTGTIDHSAWLRQQFMKIGIEQFLETPLFGIGIDNARFLLMQHFGYTTYLHNNYVELLASGGLTGTCLFYSIYVYIFKKLKKSWCKHISESKAVFAIVSAILIMDFGNISYYSKDIYFYITTSCIIVNSVLRIKRDEE